MKIKEFFVDIIELESRKVDTQLGPYTTRRMAERAERGVERNLAHSRFFTLVTTKKKNDERRVSMKNKTKRAFAAKQLAGNVWNPADLFIPTDPKDKLYDKHVEDEVPDDAVLNTAAAGIIQTIVVRKRNEIPVVIAGTQRVKRALVVNALIGHPYKGDVKAVHDAIKRMSTIKESVEVAKRVVVLTKGEPVHVPSLSRNRGTEADARFVKAAENSFRRQEDPVVMAADEAQRQAELSVPVDQIAASLRVSVATVKRYLKMDLSKPRPEKKKRGKATRPSAVQIGAFHERASESAKLTEREKLLFAWILKGGGADELRKAFGVTNDNEDEEAA